MKTVQKTLNQLVVGSNPTGVTTSENPPLPSKRYSWEVDRFCEVCGKFIGYRQNRKTCSPACRKKKSRMSHFSDRESVTR